MSAAARGVQGDGRRRSGGRVVAVAAGVMLVVGLAGCDGRQSAAEASRPATAATVPVTVAAVTQEDVPVQVPAIGWVEAFTTVTFKSRVEGQLTEVHVLPGQIVRAGDVLFAIDPRPFEAAVQLAAANLARDQALADDAQKNAEWVAQLYRGETAGQREKDQSQANAAALRATVRADEAALENAKLNLEYCVIRSPIDGRAGDLQAYRGNMVKANDTTLLTVEQIRPIYVAFAAPEQHLSAITKHQAEGLLVVEAVVPGAEGGPERGVLAFINSKVDTTTGTIRLKGKFENEGDRLWPGQYVNVTLTLTTQAGMAMVPAQAVQTGQNGFFVYVVKADQTVEMRAVEIGSTQNGRTVVEKGVSAGETVVTDGHLRLAPGARVEIKTSTTRGAEDRP